MVVKKDVANYRQKLHIPNIRGNHIIINTPSKYREEAVVSNEAVYYKS